jgi:hypothetical protein
VINTCEEWDGNREEYKTMGIDQVCSVITKMIIKFLSLNFSEKVVLETIDYTSPLLKDAERAGIWFDCFFCFDCISLRYDQFKPLRCFWLIIRKEKCIYIGNTRFV